MKRFPARSPCATLLRTAFTWSLAALLLSLAGCATHVDDEVEPPLVTGHEYFQRADAARAYGKDEQAIAAYTHAIEQDSSFVAAYFERALLKKKKGDLSGALADYDRVVFYEPVNFEALFNRAVVRRDLGDTDGALADLTEVLRLQPSYTNALVSRAAIKIDRCQMESAVTDLNRALQIDPQNLSAVATLERARKAGANIHQTLPQEPQKNIFELSLLTQQPRVLFRSPPAYPPDLWKKGITGDVVVEFIVTSGGDVVGAHAVRATHIGFVPAAVAAISAWKFYPGMKDGLPVNTRMQQPIGFHFEDVPAKK